MREQESTEPADASPPPGATPETAPVRVAYFAIHGIGRQGEGETAGDVASAFSDAAGTLGIDLEEAGSPASEDSSVLRSTDGSILVRFIDGWWDGHVTPPPLGRVLRWMLRVTPFMTLMVIAGWMLDLQAAAQTAPRRWKYPWEVLGIAAAAFALLFLPALMIVLVIANLVIIRRPDAWPRLTDIVLSTMGDAWLYRSDELDDDVLSRLRAQLNDVRDSSDHVVLVGHSQGAEIGRRLALDGGIDACIWVGGALIPLAVARTMRRSRSLPYVLWCYVLISPLLFSLLVASLLQTLAGFIWTLLDSFLSVVSGAVKPTAGLEPMRQAPWDLTGSFLAHLPLLLGFATFSLLSALLLRKLARWPSDLTQSPDCPVIMVKSLADPVCFGHLDTAAAVRYVPIRAGRAVWREHVAYFEKPETGSALWEPLLGPEDAPPPYEPRFGVMTKIVATVAAAGLIAAAYALGSAVLNAFGW